MMAALIKDPVFLLAYLAGVVGLVFQVSRMPRLQGLFDRLPALVWTFFIPMLSTSAGLIPDESPLYRALARYLLPACLVLLLISAELKAIARLGRTALVVMAAGCLGVALGCVAAFLILRPWLPAEAWKAAGALAGTWIGGSANLIAVGTTLGLSPELQGIIIIVDTVVGYTWMGLLISFAAHQERFDRWNGADRAVMDGVAAHPQFVLFGVIVIAVHALLTLAAIRLLRAPLFFFGAASQACVGGYSSAPVVAAIYHPALAPVGLLLAVLGNVIGTYAGLLVAQVLSGLAA